MTPAERQQTLVREAKKEGGLTIYGATGLDRLQFWAGEFNKIYPDIKVDYVRLLESDLVQRVLAESKAGKPQADLIMESTTYLPLLKGELAPYEAAEWGNLDARFRYGGAQDGWVAVAYEVFPEAIAWRTDKIPSDKAPKTLAAITGSDLKGRVGTTAHIARLATGLVQSYGEDGAQKKLEELGALENKIYPSHAALNDALASGQVDLAWDFIASRAMQLQAKGLPVDWVLMDPLYGESNAIAVLKTAKRPYAAALFMDTILTAKVLEASDQWDAGRLFGNTTGKYKISINDYPSLVLFPPADANTVKKWQKVGEDLFIRRQ